jgi:hypothetical protein
VVFEFGAGKTLKVNITGSLDRYQQVESLAHAPCWETADEETHDRFL